MKKFHLVIEGIDPSGMGSWGYRIGTKRPEGQMHWIANWLPSHATSEDTLVEQIQVMEDCWWNLVKQIVGVQNSLHF